MRFAKRREAIEALREENEKLQAESTSFVSAHLKAQLHEEKEKRVAEQQRLKV